MAAGPAEGHAVPLGAGADRVDLLAFAVDREECADTSLVRTFSEQVPDTAEVVRGNTVEKLSPRTAYTIHLDGRQAASFTTDDKGKAEVELTAASSK